MGLREDAISAANLAQLNADRRNAEEAAKAVEKILGVQAEICGRYAVADGIRFTIGTLGSLWADVGGEFHHVTSLEHLGELLIRFE